MSLKLISLNIERSKHLELVLPFLEREHADVVCLQELMDYDIPRFEESLGMRSYFTGVNIHPAEERHGVFGQALFAKTPFIDFSREYYYGQAGDLPLFDPTNAQTKHATETHIVSVGTVLKDDVSFRIATTHFTWTPDGLPDDFQRQDMKALLAVLKDMGEFVLCGDFNAPRRGEIFNELASRYKDNIPPEYKTSIDVNIHRAGKTEGEYLGTLMVDGLFTTPAYQAYDVRLVSGVSDHMAVVAAIEKRDSE